MLTDAPVRLCVRPSWPPWRPSECWSTVGTDLQWPTGLSSVRPTHTGWASCSSSRTPVVRTVAVAPSRWELWYSKTVVMAPKVCAGRDRLILISTHVSTITWLGFEPGHITLKRVKFITYNNNYAQKEDKFINFHFIVIFHLPLSEIHRLQQNTTVRTPIVYVHT